MRIAQDNVRFFTGVAGETSEKVTQRTTQGRMFTGKVAEAFDTEISEKREEAMQKAKKLVGDVFATEKSIDDDLLERAKRVKASEQEIVSANKELKALHEEQLALKEQYGITDDSTEQEELELLIKKAKSQKPDSGVVLTKEEQEKLALIEERGMTEYQSQYFELERFGEPYKKAISEAKAVIEEETKIISAVKLERLKSCPMVEASKEAEELMESANKEILDKMFEEGKDKIEEVAEEHKEKQEMLEEQQEVKEEKQKDQVETTEVPVNELLHLENVRKEMKQEVEHMITEMKLLVEDIKGSVVDTEL